MRLLYFDIDTLRADHLGCYGYERPTSPSIDAIADEGIRFDRTYASDTPCLPSRTALSTGRFGIHTGVAGHGGSAADPFPEGSARAFRSERALETWPSIMQAGGYWTSSISTFPERHSAFHFLAGFNEWINLGTRGFETADKVGALASEWLEHNARRDNWFLHVHFWDPHTPYRAPLSFGDPFASAPTPSWLTEEIRTQHWMLPGPHSAQEISGFGPRTVWDDYPRQPQVAGDMAAVRRMFDGYDTGIRYADLHIGHIVETLRACGVYDVTAIMISSDHGETLGELGIYCDHQTADEHVTHVPCIVRWPEDDPRRVAVDPALHYQIDVTATLLNLLGMDVPDSWDGRSFAPSLATGAPAGREFLVLTQGAWTAQRAVRFDDWIFIRTYDAGYHGFPDTMLFNLASDPHEQSDQSAAHPEVVLRAQGLLDSWLDEAFAHGPTRVDPLETVIAEGGPWHARGRPDGYFDHLRATGRGAWADVLEAR